MGTLLVNRMHRLKNRVKNIQAAVQLVLLRDHSNLRTDSHSQLVRVERETQKLFEVFEEARRFGNLVSETRAARSVRVVDFLNQAIDKCRESYTSDWRESLPNSNGPNVAIEYDYQIANLDTFINVVEEQLFEALCNLINNGIAQAAASGGGWVKVKVQVNPLASQIEILVQDSGKSGMTRAEFEFYSSGNGRTDGSLGFAFC